MVRDVVTGLRDKLGMMPPIPGTSSLSHESGTAWRRGIRGEMRRRSREADGLIRERRRYYLPGMKTLPPSTTSMFRLWLSGSSMPTSEVLPTASALMCRVSPSQSVVTRCTRKLTSVSSAKVALLLNT